MKGGKDNLAEGAVEDKGVLALDSLQQVRHSLPEGVAGVVKRPRDVGVVAPLLVPAPTPMEESTIPRSAKTDHDIIHRVCLAPPT